MERKEGIHKKLILYFIPIFYSIGILIHLTALNEKILNYLTPISLLAINILVIAYGFIGIKKSLIWLIASYLLTFFLEVIGVKSGLVFGSYEYGNGLGLKFLDVPLIIGLNWVVVVLGATALSERISSTKIKYVLTGLIAVVFDIALEKVAPILDYWAWNNDIIPTKNFVSWFLIAFTLHLIYDKIVKEKLSIIFGVNIFSQFVFFLILLMIL